MITKSKKKYQKIINNAQKIDKNRICRLIALQTGVDFKHVQLIVNIFLDEFRRDLLAGKTIRIINFGKFELFQPEKHAIFNINTSKHEVVEPKKRLRFSLERRLTSFLSKFLSI